jgi:HD-like signal output (HDOD) protein
MIATAVLIAACLAVAGWLAIRARGALDGPKMGPNTRRTAAVTPPEIAGTDVERLRAANRLLGDRLWRLAFALPPEAPPSHASHASIRTLVLALLDVDTLDPNFFPRRPSLLPQLLTALNDPRAESDKLARIIAHDPVITADVLRLANSSLYRTTAAPIETIQRAIVVCGADALRGILAAAMLLPVFRATRSNFPRLPRMLWERTERAVRAVELHAMETHPQDRFEAQLAVLLSALGPLVVYGAALDVYARYPELPPSPALCVELTSLLGPQMSVRIARDWQTAPRLLAALENSSDEPLNFSLHVGEFLGTLSFLESQTIISTQERRDLVAGAGLSAQWVDGIWERLMHALS